MTDPIRGALIDDDEAVLDSLRLYLDRKGFATTCFCAAAAFLTEREHARRFDCVVADVRMPGLSGLELVRRLRSDGAPIPVILITGHGDVEMGVVAIKLGAFDFIEKPFDEARLLSSIHEAVGHERRRLDEEASVAAMRSRVESLSERQRQVMELAAQGLSNKQIAANLHISLRTVEIHRAWMMQRMGARNLAELVRIVMQLRDPRP